MKRLILTVGLPRSGKSTWAKKQGLPIVNPDAIRLGLHGERFISEAEPFVWAIAKVMVNALFLAGHEEVILDATNITKARRDDWKGPWKRLYQVIDTMEDVCISRAEREGDKEIIPIIRAMAKKYEPVGRDEVYREKA